MDEQTKDDMSKDWADSLKPDGKPYRNPDECQKEGCHHPGHGIIICGAVAVTVCATHRSEIGDYLLGLNEQKAWKIAEANLGWTVENGKKGDVESAMVRVMDAADQISTRVKAFLANPIDD